MGRLTPASVAAILLVAACGGSTESLAFPTSTRPVLLRTHAAIPACAGTPRGKPECGALVQKLGFQSATPAGWSPAELESAYDLPSRTKGAGQIVAVVDAYDNPNVASDLAEYRSAFGLPTANFTKYNQNGQMRNYPKGNKGWGTQIDQDVEMVSASCPYCTIYLVEASSNAWADLETAEAQAVTLGAHIVSNSYEGSGANQDYYDTKGVTYLASAGNSPGNLLDPADFDSVVAVGGTVLSRGDGKRGWTEVIWPDAGGGCSSQTKLRGNTTERARIGWAMTSQRSLRTLPSTTATATAAG